MNLIPNKTKYRQMKAVNRSVKSWLQDNIIEINSVHNEGKSVAAERFITLLKKK